MVSLLSPAVQEDYRRDLQANEAPSFIGVPSIVPVWPVGGGVPRPSADQSVRSTLTIVTAAAGDVYTQIATTSSVERVFFIGYLIGRQGDNELTSRVYIEDANSGNISPTTASTVALTPELSVINADPASTGQMFLPFPRECKRGIRLLVTSGATETVDTSVIIYYLIERTDGQHQPV